MENSNVKLASYIGLAQRAGAAIYGEDDIVKNLPKIKIVLLKAQAPDKFKARLRRRLSDVEIFEIDNLAAALHRDNIYAVGVSNTQLAKAISDILR